MLGGSTLKSFVLKNHCHACFTRDGGVIFDSSNDRYVLLSEDETDQLQRALIGDQRDAPLLPKIEAFLSREEAGTVRPLFCDIAKGLHDYTWRYMPYDRSGYTRSRSDFAFVLWIYVIQFLLKLKGIAGTLRFVERHPALFRTCLQELEPAKAADKIMIAARLSPFRFECLEFSLAMRCYASLHSWKNMRLYLGIQRFPFIAHAWVELGGEPIGDDPLLRNRAAIIFEA